MGGQILTHVPPEMRTPGRVAPVSKPQTLAGSLAERWQLSSADGLRLVNTEAEDLPSGWPRARGVTRGPECSERGPLGASSESSRRPHGGGLPGASGMRGASGLPGASGCQGHQGCRGVRAAGSIRAAGASGLGGPRIASRSGPGAPDAFSFLSAHSEPPAPVTSKSAHG